MQNLVGGGPIGTEGVSEAGGGRRKTTALAVVLLLLLLLTVSSVVYQNLTRDQREKAEFLAANARCLVCHAELVPLLEARSVHHPFGKEQCTSCHTTHGDLFEKRIGVADSTGANLRRACGPFIPIAAVQALLDRIFGQPTVKSWKTTSEARKDYKQGDLVYRPFMHAKLVNTELKLCMTCHGNLGGLWQKKYGHPPFIQGFCTNCHDPHASNDGPLLVREPKALCTSCHPIATELKQAQVHPPFELQDCLSCHGPHASDDKVLLRGPQKTVCLACHPTIGPYFGYSVQHAPFGAGDCTGCHEAHAAPVKPLLPRSEPNFCYECHPEIQSAFSRASRHPVGTLINCSSCHQPHAAHYSSLLLASGNEMCYSCHGDKRLPYVYTAHNEVEYTAFRGACANCHEAHGSDYAPLLDQEELTLCGTCHPAYRRERVNHPYYRQTSFPRAGGKVTCAASCHDPHGTQYRNMLRKLPDGLCLTCHPVSTLP